MTFTKEDFDPVNKKDVLYVRCDEFLEYEGFYNDFGPYNICNIYHYCNLINEKLKEVESDENSCVVQYTSTNKEERLNSAFAIGCYAVSLFLPWKSLMFEHEKVSYLSMKKSHVKT